MITLIGSDGKEVEVEKAVAMMSLTIRPMIEEEEEVIPIPVVCSTTLSKVFLYCEKHLELSSEEEDELKEFDDEFANVDVDTLWDLINGANYLEVKDLLELVCQKAADLIRGKTAEEIREILNIEKNLTPEEEQEIYKENEWAFN